MGTDSSKEVSADGISIEKDKVIYESKLFVGILIAILELYLLNNVIVLFQNGIPFSLLPIAVQSLLLYLIISKHNWVRTAIRAWAMLMIVGGGAKILDLILRSPKYNITESATAFSGVTIGAVFMMVFQFMIGCIYFFLTKRYIKAY